jgi:hypothetical protein
MTEAASPGILTKMDVVDPPYMAPYMIPQNMMIPETAGRCNVIGKRRAIAPEGPMPGRTPIRVPQKTPKKQ